MYFDKVASQIFYFPAQSFKKTKYINIILDIAWFQYYISSIYANNNNHKIVYKKSIHK
jgi:hypothetical protein